MSESLLPPDLDALDLEGAIQVIQLALKRDPDFEPEVEKNNRENKKEVDCQLLRGD